MIDLHTHSSASDGTYSPSELIQKAKQSGIEAIALTDHDNTDGIPEAQAKADAVGIELVHGVELSALPPKELPKGAELHILGFDIDIESEGLRNGLARVKAARIERVQTMVEKLGGMGMPITPEELKEYGGDGIVGRCHIAKAMTAMGYADSIGDAFDRYLSAGRPAYVSNFVMDARAAIELILSAGGIPCCAHLHHLHLEGDELYAFLKKLKSFGLAAIEGYYPAYTKAMGEEYRGMAAALGLKLSGGTDFHGANRPDVSLGIGRGSMNVPYSVLASLRA